MEDNKLRLTRHLAAGALGVALFVVLVPAAGSRAPVATAGLVTEVEYSGSWTHTYTGKPSGSVNNPGTETFTSKLTFTESVSLFTPFANGGRTLGSANSQNSPVRVALSGQATLSYTGSNLTGCSASFSARSGLKGNQWYVGGFGQPLAYISVNEQATKGVVAVWAEAPGLRSSSHPEFVNQRTGGDPTDNTCDSGNMPGGPFPCDDLPLINDPAYTPGDRGFNKPPYGFLHAVAKLDPHTPSYSHNYNVRKVLSSCAGSETVTATSHLIVNNSHANGLPSKPTTTTAPPPTPKPKPCSPPKPTSAVRRDVTKQMIDQVGGMDRDTIQFMQQHPDAAALALALAAYAKGLQQGWETAEAQVKLDNAGFICAEGSIFSQDFDGSLGGTRRVQQVTGPLFRLHVGFPNGKPGTPTVTVDRTQLAKLLTLSSPTKLTVTANTALKRGGPVTVSRSVTLEPRPAKPAITGVTFSGSATDPTVVIHGTSLGKAPAPDPTGHPSGLNGCPVVANDNGYLYGTSLYIAVPSGNFSGGRYRPSLNETDCLDLVVTKFTSTEVDFHFGPFYTSFYPKFALAAGLQVTVVVNGATFDTTVRYG